MLRIEDGGSPEVLVGLNRHVHDWHVKAYPEIFRDGEESFLYSYFKSSLEKPNFHHYIAYEDAKDLGFAQVEIRDFPGSPFRHPQRSIFIHIIVVLPECRGRGIGEALMGKVHELAAEHGITRIELDHWAGNESASRFFGKMGFKPFRHFMFLEQR